jgi:hypothetical protein
MPSRKAFAGVIVSEASPHTVPTDVVRPVGNEIGCRQGEQVALIQILEFGATKSDQGIATRPQAGHEPDPSASILMMQYIESMRCTDAPRDGIMDPTSESV